MEGEGAFEGQPEGEGVIEGQFEGEGPLEGQSEGQSEGEGVIEGQFEGEGPLEGQSEGQPEGEGIVEGQPEGHPEGTLEGEGGPEGQPEGEGLFEGQLEGQPEEEGVIEGQPEGGMEGEGGLEGEGPMEEGENEGAMEGEGEGGEGGIMSVTPADGALVVFDRTSFKTHSHTTVQVRNSGNGSLDVYARMLEGSTFSIQSSPVFRLTPGETVDVDLIFTPTENRWYSDAVALEGGGARVLIYLSGEGVNPPIWSCSGTSTPTRSTPEDVAWMLLTASALLLAGRSKKKHASAGSIS